MRAITQRGLIEHEQFSGVDRDVTYIGHDWKKEGKDLLIVDVCVLAECMLEVVRFLPRGDEQC